MVEKMTEVVADWRENIKIENGLCARHLDVVLGMGGHAYHTAARAGVWNAAYMVYAFSFDDQDNLFKVMGVRP